MPRAGGILRAYVSATYRDLINGENRAITSNNVAVAVARVANVELSVGSSYVLGNQGETVVAAITVLNTGNDTDAFNLNITAPPGWTAQVYLDPNGDGKHQAGEQVISQTPIMEPGAQAQIVLTVGVPQQEGIVTGSVSITAASSYDRSVTDSGSVVFSFEPTNSLPELYDPTLTITTDGRGKLHYTGVVYRDKDGEIPDVDQPVVWINNPDEKQYTGVILEISGSIIVCNEANWIPGQFRGEPVQIDLPGQLVYTVIDNTEITLYVDGNLQADGAAPGQTFRLQQVLLTPQSGEVTTGKTYFNTMPYAPKARQAHFSVTSRQNYDGEVRAAYARCPKSGELSCPIIAPSDDTNRAPVLSNASVTPTVCRFGNTVNMSVTYSDPNGDPPNESGGLRGYIWAVVDGYPRTMQVNGSSFVDGVVCGYATNIADLGVHSVYFVASDGKIRVRYPVDSTLSFRVNSPPSLREPMLSPSAGSAAREFTYSVVYSDLDGLPPSSVSVLIAGRAVALAADAVGNLDYRNGVRFKATMRGSDIGIGAHNYQFVASDGLESVSAPMSPAPGPIVTQSNPPTLSGGAVNPTSGSDHTAFRFTVTYKDIDGDPPAYVRAIVGDQPAILMARQGIAGETFENGALYAADAFLPAGHYQYRFEASDSAAVAQDPPGGGVRSGIDVIAQKTTQISFDAGNQYVIGESCTISGIIAPGFSGELHITATRPTGSYLRYSTTTTADGKFSLSFIPDMTGPWQISASWAGSEYHASSSAVTNIGVGGPALLTGGLQMIGVPYIPVNSTPIGTFGAEPAFMVARWLPTQSKYTVFDTTGQSQSDANFPGIAPGRGYWFGTLKPKFVLPIARLVDQNAAFTISLNAGWNQIGFVYLKPSPWGSVKVKAGGREYSLMDAYRARIIYCFAWTYDGAMRGYKVVHPTIPNVAKDLEPWRGYWVFARQDCQLVLQPPQEQQTLSQASVQALAEENDDWGIRLTARLVSADQDQKTIEDTDNFIGVSSYATEANFQSPAYRDDYVDLYFPKPFGADSPGRYASDYRTSVKRSDGWKFVVESDLEEGDCTVAWTGLEHAPCDLPFILEDLSSGRKVNMRECVEYIYSHRKGVDRRFKITVGE